MLPTLLQSLLVWLLFEGGIACLRRGGVLYDPVSDEAWHLTPKRARR